MKEHPILFSAPMVRAILEGRKTQTRRIIKGVPSYMHYGRDIMDWSLSGIHQDEYLENNQLQASDMWYLDVQTDVDDHSRKLIHCPYGQPGDRLWVRETWRKGWTYGGDYPTAEYLADNAAHIGWEQRPVMAVPHKPYPASHGGKWKPSIHMPRWASRILLEVVSVRVERLRDIEEADAQAEGCSAGGWSPLYSNSDNAGGDEYWSAVDDFCNLWSFINGPESWADNPWVWVVEFRRVEP